MKDIEIIGCTLVLYGSTPLTRITFESERQLFEFLMMFLRQTRAISE